MLELLTMLLQIDKTLGIWITQYGAWIYLVLFMIVFCETGLVVLPFLPGDSLLFIAGAFAATGSMDAGLLIVLLIVAATAGNTVNYWVGRRIGPKVFSQKVRFLDREALIRTHGFYEKHGGKTLVIARFLPVIRTFAPFVAGIGYMNVGKFQLFNFIGATLWVAALVLAGYFFGNLPLVKEHLNSIVLIGLAAAIVPVVLGALWKGVRQFRKKDAPTP